MTPEERTAKEGELARLKQVADAAHQAAAAASGTDDGLNKAADDAEDAFKALEQELAASPPPPTDDEGADEDIDFDKELQQLEQNAQPDKPARTELEKAERALHFNAEQVRKLGGDPTKVVPPAAPPTAPAKPAEDNSEYMRKGDFAEIEAGKLARSEAERKVIMHHYHNSIVRTGSISNDIENAYMLANKGRITRSFAEIRRTQGAYRPPAPNGPGRRPAAEPAKAPELTDGEKATMQRRGYKQLADGSWESKRYKFGWSAQAKSWATTRKK